MSNQYDLLEELSNIEKRVAPNPHIRCTVYLRDYQYRQSPRYTVNGDLKQPQNTAYLEFPRKSNLVISTKNTTNFRITLQLGGGFSHLINYLIWFWLHSTILNHLKWFLTFDQYGKYLAFHWCVKSVQFAQRIAKIRVSPKPRIRGTVYLGDRLYTNLPQLIRFQITIHLNSKYVTH